MKLNNGKNIILDSDVTVSGEGSLSDILNQHKTELDQLKRNVKWLYKYGGVGSGTGGGGSESTSKWYILVDINGVSYQATSNDSGEISTGNLIVNGANDYPITIKVMRPGGSSFSALISWFNGTSTNTVRKSLNSENSWTVTQIMKLAGNNTISVQVTDNEYTATLNVSYITSPYVFTLELADADGSNPKVTGADIFIGDVEESGLKAKLSYDIGIEVAEDVEGNKNGVTYTITDILGNVKDTQVLDLSQGNKGFIMLDLVDDPNFLLDDNNSATYTYYLTIDVVTKGGGTSSTEKFDLSFNLIPTSLFLKIIPDKGTIYQSHQDNPEYVYFTGAKSFSITPFFGDNTGKSIVVNIDVDGIQLIPNTSIKERSTLTGVTLDINNTEEGIKEHIINFNASHNNVSKTFTYYLYAKQLNSNLKWYPINNNSILQEPVKKNYWRNVTDKTFDLTNASALQMTSQSDEVVINVETPNSPRDVLFAAGILYSEINSSQHPIISLHCNGNNSGEAYINIYYDKVTLASSVEGTELSIDCYINKTPYNKFVINSKEYHLLQVYKRLLKYDDVLKARYYEIVVYIDGTLERSFSTWSQYELGYDLIILHPSNYYINLLELSYFNHTISNKKTYDWLSDANIVRYWYTYLALKLEVEDLNTEILGLFENNVDLTQDVDYYDLPITDSGTLKLIAENSDVPILKLQYEEDGTTSFLDWFTNCNYGENDIIPSKLVSVSYSKGKSDFVNIIVNGCLFYIEIQGSTTRKYRGKNLELLLKSIFEGDTNTYIFSPNFDPSNDQTFLPELSFTLKADAVDSSHSNNTTMGDFINKNTLKFADAALQGSQYGKYIKNCLTGFPVLVFIDVKQPNGTSTTYYLGIYNFNLGRKSFFNLGYIDTNVLDNVKDVADDSTELKEGFHVYKIPQELTNKLPSFLSAEITGNDARYDFSQYDSSLLVRDKNNENDQYAMFDDIETGILSTDELTTVLLNMVEGVAKAGYYIFKSIGKNFGNYDEGYSSVLEDGTSKNQVPNYKIQYVREIDLNGSSTFIPKDKEAPDGNNNDLNVLINPFNDQGLVNKIDYQSLVEYYTICMIFGLFDSVQKNLNVKTWNKNKFYLAFYDMDTCLGVDNAGNDSNYFAFSDYWDSSYKTVEIDGKEVLRPSVINIYRDFSPANNHGFDIASSYLFAVAKYSKIFEDKLPNEDGTILDLTFPARLWANWRKSNGELQNSKYFIENYYKHHLNGVNELMFNYNYRAKYFVQDKDENGNSLNRYDTANHGKFKGRRLEYVRQWLDGRFHLLDAYFNLPPRTLNPITKLDLDTKEWSKVIFDNEEIYEPKVLPDEVDTTNTDIYVINSIFGNLARFNNSINLIIKTSDYSPLFLIPSGGNAEKMLFVDSDTYYNVYSERVGLNNITLGGSSQWTELDSINCFAGSLTLQSNLLSNLNGTQGNISNWSINLPSIKTINLTSPGYTGSLSLNTNTPDLTSVNISNSKLSLNLDNKPSLKTINANNCKGAALSISNCNNIENISLSGTFGEINIDGVPINIYLNNIKSTSIRMTTGKPDLTFSLFNDNTITKLELLGFKSVNVLNCTKLKEVSISGDNTESITVTNSQSLESLVKVDLNIKNCKSLNLSNNFNLRTLNLTKSNSITNLNLRNTSVNKIIWDGEENNEYLDLSYFTKLTTLNLLNNDSVEYIQFKNIENEPFVISTPFTNCTNLKRVYGNLLINTSGCFANLRYFSIHGSNPTTYKGLSIYNGLKLIPIYELLGDRTNSLPISNLYLEGTKVTNITFRTSNADSTYSGTNCSIFDIYYTFYNIGNATSVRNMFSALNNPVQFNWTEEVDNSPNRFMFNKANRITNISNLFYQTGSGNRIRIFSPNDTEIGLLTPLTSVTNMDLMFGSYRYIIDRNVFKSNITFNLLYLRYFNPELIVDDVNALEYIPEINISNIRNYLENYGNISTFFDNLTNLVNIDGLFRNTLYINYNNDSFHIPDSVTSIRAAFISTYGNGAMKFSNYFSGESKLKLLQGSFIVNNKIDVSYLFGSIKSEVTLEISSNMFNNLTNITHIGYDETGGNFASTYKNHTFSGAGLKKSLKNGEFPYTITYNLPYLQQFSGVFSGIITKETLELPGNMFENNVELKDVSGAFYNLYADIKLTTDSFINCTNLTKASYLFAKEYLPDSNNNLNYHILTSIPNKFFYHGSIKNTITIKGCYESDVLKLEDDTIIYPENPEEISIEVTTPLSTITNLNYCFKNNDIVYYTETFGTNDIENNPDYNPFDYIYLNNKWTRNPNKDTRRYLFYWKYNGNLDISSYNLDDYVIPEEMIVDRATDDSNYKVSNFTEIAGNGANVTNFFCSPDLLRYCTPSCVITGLFSDCGKRGANSWVNGGGLYNTLREWGIKGRICPYLLKPVSGTLNLSHFMDNCKGLSNYELNGDTYFIPRTFFSYTPNINDLSYAFLQTFFAENAKLDNIFSYLGLSLKIEGIFLRCLLPLNVISVFANNDISRTRYAFAMSTMTGTDTTPRFYSQSVSFSNIFKDYSKIKGNENYQFTFHGYNPSKVTHEDPKTLSAIENDHNYTTNI